MTSATIKWLKGREILDSRGNPTVEVEVRTESGFGRASVPSGASTGSKEAWEKRDGDKNRFGGKGVLKAVEIVNTVVREELLGRNALEQREIDDILIALDGTENKERLGANALLGTSMAVCKAAADSLKKPLFKYLREEVVKMKSEFELPTPMMNVINGGKHAGNELSIQEFLILPLGFERFSEKLRAGVETYHALKKVLERKPRYGKAATNVGDEGGYAPQMRETTEALEAVVEAVSEAGYSETEIRLGVDAAASSFFDLETRKYKIDGVEKDGSELIDFYEGLVEKYPLELLEDPFEEDSFGLFAELTAKTKMQRKIIVGDDLFVTNVKRLREGVKKKAANAVLLKLNQIGTVSETLETVRLAGESGYKKVVSHRSGETEDTFIADFAVAINAEIIKTGAPARSERTCKYNQLLRIEEALTE
ncbi:phosphopyruvate hydratase [ANME-1 cluster archaeon ex4572_4]|nr:MAG: phosphopyruvate hydratase [ANME-1 cluster archaeon ex4572_4]HDN68026.1 phosphopyruvate hydratase [Methanomicrobia archaeon]